MHKLSKDATRIFLGILNRIPAGESHTKIQIHQGDRPIFMPLIVEYLYDLKVSGQKAKVYSLMHTYEQQGDIMRDPDVEFAVVDARTAEYPVIEMIAIYPLMIQQSAPAYCHELVVMKDGAITGFKNKLQRDVVRLSNQWMQNIKQQQQIEPVKIPDVLTWMKLQRQLKNAAL
jgi:hypothetical protein